MFSWFTQDTSNANIRKTVEETVFRQILESIQVFRKEIFLKLFGGYTSQVWTVHLKKLELANKEGQYDLLLLFQCL